MKLYVLSYMDDQKISQVKAFSSRAKANAALKEVEGTATLLDGIHDVEFPGTISGLIEAVEYGASLWK